MSKTFQDCFAQKVAETVSVAVNNFLPNGTPCLLDQEVFGIAVCHHFFTFWHAVVPASYLNQISKTTEALNIRHFVKLKCYPQSTFGLDICDPKECKEIFKVMIGLQSYLMDKPFIGNWLKVEESKEEDEEGVEETSQ